MAPEADQPCRRLASSPVVVLSVRPAIDADAEAIRGIYNPEVLESTVTFDLVPRSLDDQLAWQHERSGAHVVLVAVDEDGAVAGYGSLSTYKHRAAYSTTVEDSVYVHRDRQGQGVGRLLLAELLTVATAHGFHAVIARIVGGHDASIRPARRRRLRDRGHRAGGRPQVRSLARRRRDATSPLGGSRRQTGPMRSQTVEIVEVSPRDGLQAEDVVLPTADKVALIERAVAAGVRRIEVCSFVNPTRVPQMADAEAVLAALPDARRRHLHRAGAQRAWAPTGRCCRRPRDQRRGGLHRHVRRAQPGRRRRRRPSMPSRPSPLRPRTPTSG